MHLAYSALQNTQNPTPAHRKTEDELTLRYKAYQAVCEKYSCEIAAIQKFFPGWAPAFTTY